MLANPAHQPESVPELVRPRENPVGYQDSLQRRLSVWTTLRLLALLLAWTFPATAPSAHEVPADVRVTAYLKPEGDVLQMMIRVPMDAMQEVEFPLRGPGFLEISRADDALRGAVKLWITDNLDVFENGEALPTPTTSAVRVTLPSDRSFDRHETAGAVFSAPRLTDDMDLVWRQLLLDAVLEFPIRSETSEFAVEPRFERMGMRVNTTLIVMGPEGEARRFELHGNPGVVHLDPRPGQVAARFLRAGFWQVPGGASHVLFLLCLLLPFRRPQAMAVLVGAFAAGCVVALAGAAFNFMPTRLWFPPLMEALVAASIVGVAIDAVFGSTLQRRWMLAFVAGIAHGYAMSFLLGEEHQFAGAHATLALASYDLGVILGIAATALLAGAALGLLFARAASDRLGVIVLSVLIGHVAWHWMVDSAVIVSMYPMPVIDALFLAGLTRALLAALILGGAMYLVAQVTSRDTAGGDAVRER